MRVPYWHQTSEASCGPSCLLMIFNYYNPKYGLSREKEWELWRETSLLSWRGTHPYGLTIAALKRGFKVTLIREKKTIWRDKKFPKNNEPLRQMIKLQEAEAKKLGLVEKINRNIGIDLLKRILEEGNYPIILMRFIRKNGSLGIGHYSVVLKVERDYVILHDPYARANRKIPMKTFMKGWNGIRDYLKTGQNKEVLVIEK